MPTTKRKVNCPYCDKLVNAQGLGGHIMLAHGIVEKVIVKTGTTPVQHGPTTRVTNTESTSVNTSKHKFNTGGNTSSTQEQQELTRVQPPDRYIKKNETVVDKIAVSKSADIRLRELAQIHNKHYKAQTPRSDIKGFKEWQEAITEFYDLIAGKPSSNPDSLLSDNNWYKKNPDKILGTL